MTRLIAMLAAAAAIAATPVLAQTQPQGPGPGAARARAEVVAAPVFMREAAMNDRYQIASGRIAGQKSQNSQVKAFAQRMVQDHEATAKELLVVRQQVPGMGAGAETPLPQGREVTGNAASGPIANSDSGPQNQGLDPQHTALLQQLQAAEGAELDRLYITQQVAVHRQVVDMFRNYSQSGDNPQLQQWAARTLPVLQDHLQLAIRLQRATQG